MSITFNSAGGFLNGTISSSGIYIFIQTSGSIGSVNVGNVEYTGSQVIEKDSSGKVRNKRIFNEDGSITQQKFDQNEKITETKIKDPGKGRELVQSASATSNQIEFQQNAAGALIIASGSNPGFTAFMNDVGDRAFRARGDVFSSGSGGGLAICSTGVAMNGSPMDYYIQMNHIGALGTTHTFGDSNGTGFFMVSQSGDSVVSNDLIVQGGVTANALNVTHFTSSFVTSSTIQTEGSNVFGDTTSDSHTFNGDITASGNISASATSTGSFGMGFFAGRVGIGDTPIDAPLEVHLGNTTQIISDRAGNGSNIQLKRSGTTKGTLSTNNTSGQEFEIFSSGDLIFNESDGDNVGIGMTSPSAKLDVTGDLRVSSHITASGAISASGEYIGNQIQIYQANFTDDINTTTHFVPLGTSTFETTGEDFPAVGLVAPYDGELVKIIYRHSFDASSTTTRWVLSVIPDGTDMDGTAVTRLRATVTGATADTIQEVTVADNDGSLVDDMFFNKGETIFLSIRNSSDVTTSVSTDDFHITVVLKFNVPLGLI